jgi:vitamin B12 transporter
VVGSLTNLKATEPAGVEVRRPKNQAALDAGWRIGGGALRFDLGVTYNGDEVDTDFGVFLRKKIDPYTLVRMAASYRLNDTVELYGRVENVTDADYQEVIGFKGAPRTAYLGIRFSNAASKASAERE